MKPTRGSMALLALGLLCVPALSEAQINPGFVGCSTEFRGCAQAPIRYNHREGLPVEVDIDTDWQPRNSPVQVRFRAALVGHTDMRQEGFLIGQWPEPMQLSVLGTPQGGTLETDWGVQLLARIRLQLEVEGRSFNWEGNIPYVPQVDFRATGRTVFDPWAFSEVRARGMTMRAHIADVPISDAIVRIPGVSGGFSFDAGAEVEAAWRSVRFDFGLQADPITRADQRVQGLFTAGPFVEYSPVLEGVLSYAGTLRVYPSMYVTLLGRRWTLDLPNLPINLGPFPRNIRTMPSVAHLELPDVRGDGDLIDFGEVTVGERVERSITLRNDGEGAGSVLSVTGEGAFGVESGVRALPARSRGTVLVAFAPVRPGAQQGEVVIDTNDPDTPRVRVTVRGTGVGLPMVETDAGEPVMVAEDAGFAADGAPMVTAQGDGGCGCRVPGWGGREGGWQWMAALGVVLAVRRRRKVTVD